MRPGHSAPENWAFQPDSPNDQPASMRPGHSAPENPNSSESNSGVPSSCFNEAGAFSPGKQAQVERDLLTRLQLQ